MLLIEEFQQSDADRGRTARREDGVGGKEKPAPLNELHKTVLLCDWVLFGIVTLL